MMPCCDLTYSQYINEDGSIDFYVYLKSVENLVDHVIGAARHRLENGYGINKTGVPEISFNENKICKCPCHIKGSMVMH